VAQFPAGIKDFLFSKASRPSLGSSLYLYDEAGLLSSGVKWPGRLVAEIKKE